MLPWCHCLIRTLRKLEGTDPVELLENFGLYKLAQPELNPLGLAHLFVTRDLDDSNPPTQTIGIAAVGTLCDARYGVALTEATGFSIINAMAFAHEVGHNFGAPHDAEAGSACEAAPDSFIMAPTIDGTTRFSQCSIDQMLPEIVSAPCMPEVIPTDLQLSVASPPPSSVNEGERIQFDVMLANLSSSAAVGLEVFLSSAGFGALQFDTSVIGDRVSEGECTISSEARCVFPYFDAAKTAVLRLFASADIPGSHSIAIRVDSLNELDPGNNELVFDIEIISLADLSSTLTPTNAILHPGESLQFQATVRNQGAFAANEVIANVTVGNFDLLQLTQIDLTGCIPPDEFAYPRVHNCPVGVLEPQAEISFGFTVHLPPDADLSELGPSSAQFVGVSATSREVPILNSDAGTGTQVTIGNAIADLDLQLQGPAVVQVGESASWQFTLTSTGPDTVESVRIYSDDAGRTLPSSATTISSTRGMCELTTENAEFECTFDSFEAGASATVTLTITPESTGEFFVIEAFTEAADPDNNLNNNHVFLSVSASNDPVPGGNTSNNPPVATRSGGGGGGGNMGVVSLLAVILLAGWRRRIRQAI